MRRSILVLVAAAIAAISVPSARWANAQCAFAHPRTAKGMTMALVQPFVSCNNPGGNLPTGTTVLGQGGPSCQPTETYHQAAGSPSDGWVIGPRGSGAVSFRIKGNNIHLPGSIDDADNSVDVSIMVKIRDIVDAFGVVVTTDSGSMTMRLRVTLDDRVGGDMTIVDVPVGVGFSVDRGTVKLKTSVNAVILNGFASSLLPGCTSIELLDVELRDRNGTLFAVPGLYLPRRL